MIDRSGRPNDGDVRLSEVLAALSQSLDITEGQPMGHSARSCAIGMRIADEIELPVALRSSLFYALLLKDAGCSSNAAKICALFGHDDLEVKRDRKSIDQHHLSQVIGYITRNARPGASPISRAAQLTKIIKHGSDGSRALTQIRCDRGATIARMLGFDEHTALAIRALDEHWNGDGYPDGLAGEDIPLLGRILNISQTIEIFFRADGIDTVYEVLEARRGKWFDPALVDAMISIRKDSSFWSRIGQTDVKALVAELEPEDRVLMASQMTLDRVAEAFSLVIDAKSPYTATHSLGVADIAVGIAKVRGLGPTQVRDLRRAALLHDIGKLGVSNTILDKPGKLTDQEWKQMRMHPKFSMDILKRVEVFRGLAEVAGAHHERLDGKGYHRGLSGDQLDEPSRILAVADVCEALSARRPYRDAMPMDRVFEIMDEDAGTQLCAESLEALKVFVDSDGSWGNLTLAA